jgi:hypothetical protein
MGRRQRETKDGIVRRKGDEGTTGAIVRVRGRVARTHLGGSLGGGFFLGHVRARAVRVRVDDPSVESTVLEI